MFVAHEHVVYQSVARAGTSQKPLFIPISFAQATCASTVYPILYSSHRFMLSFILSMDDEWLVLDLRTQWDIITKVHSAMQQNTRNHVPFVLYYSTPY